MHPVLILRGQRKKYREAANLSLFLQYCSVAFPKKEKKESRESWKVSHFANGHGIQIRERRRLLFQARQKKEKGHFCEQKRQKKLLRCL
jgi:hypothetical protein